MPMLTHHLSADVSDGLLTFSVDGLRDDGATGPAHGIVNEPGTPTDFVILGYAYPFGISDHAQDAFARAGLTGWATRTLVLHGWRSPSYAALQVSGRCGPLDWSRSTAVENLGRWTRYRGLIPSCPNSVDDFCLPDGYNSILVTERVADCVVRERLTGCECVPLAEAMAIR